MAVIEKSLNVLVVEDETFTKNIVSEMISKLGHNCKSVTNVNDALISIKNSKPNLVITDLDLGEGPSGLDLINKIHKDYPEINLVVLTAHRSPLLVDANFKQLPPNVRCVIKSEIDSTNTFEEIFQNMINNKKSTKSHSSEDDKEILVSRTQAELLQLIAQGFSNQAIAEKRGTTLRAVEALVNRTYEALNLKVSDSRNLRVEAVKLWKSSKINVK
jgi:DNA-binding NarL/FixJ family response regulator